jgi:SAM-dependent methyltransferase
MSFKLAKWHNWLIFQIVNPALASRLQQYATGKLLDIGCGEKPYRDMAAPYVSHHIGIDQYITQHETIHIDIFSTAYHIPVASQTFDTVLCTYVLEHLEEPDWAIAESFRVLKPGGYAIYTVPLFWHIHEAPRDFYRYTAYGLRYLFQKNGYEVVEIKALSGFVVTFVQEFSYVLLGFRKLGKPFDWIVRIIQAIIQMIAYLLNHIDYSHNFTIEYLAVFKKPL